ncbi:hypothetical protein GCM10028862_05020 [Luteimonas pelagia]
MIGLTGAPRVGAWCACVAALAFATVAQAASSPPVAGPVVEPGEPMNVAAPKDPEFGVETKRHGLRRAVAMLQWRRAGGGYARTWADAPVDDAGHPDGRANPDFPIPSREWIAEVRVDGRPLAREALLALGEWRPLRPDFASLPGNMSATFQPEGDGLGTAANPQAPEVGDLRITWQALHLPPLAGRIVLDDGTWRLAPGVPARPGGPDVPAMEEARVVSGVGWLDWRVALLALGVLALLGIAVARRR